MYLKRGCGVKDIVQKIAIIGGSGPFGKRLHIGDCSQCHRQTMSQCQRQIVSVVGDNLCHNNVEDE